ncbi:MAG TPA: hypothetical protein QF924_21755, partial [Pseudomonadales bacterium]|nr:hypothetical protein [Pseudomonadales bacterium]
MHPIDTKIETREEASEGNSRELCADCNQGASGPSAQCNNRKPEQRTIPAERELSGLVEGLPLTPGDIPRGAKIKMAIECGSTTVKVIVLDEMNRPAYGIYRKHHARTYQESAKLLRDSIDLFNDRQIINVGFSGSSGQGIHGKLASFVHQALTARYGDQCLDMPNVMYVNEVVAQVFPIAGKYVGQEVHIFEIGGEDSKYIKLDHTGEMTDNELNGECAAGTGTFIE